jgi:hypothetical protein
MIKKMLLTVLFLIAVDVDLAAQRCGQDCGIPIGVREFNNLVVYQSFKLANLDSLSIDDIIIQVRIYNTLLVDTTLTGSLYDTFSELMSSTKFDAFRLKLHGEQTIFADIYSEEYDIYIGGRRRNRNSQYIVIR